MPAVPLHLDERHAGGDRDEHRAGGDRPGEAPRDRGQVVRLDRQQHHIRADAGALRVVGHAHAMVREGAAAVRDQLGDGDRRGLGDAGGEDAAQEGFAHEAAADDPDPHAASSTRRYERLAPKMTRPSRTTVEPSSTATA